MREVDEKQEISLLWPYVHFLNGAWSREGGRSGKPRQKAPKF